jgi:hypothetical protein
MLRKEIYELPQFVLVLSKFIFSLLADKLEVLGKQNRGYRVVYDDDGPYFRTGDPIRSLVLIAQGQ